MYWNIKPISIFVHIVDRIGNICRPNQLKGLRIYFGSGIEITGQGSNLILASELKRIPAWKQGMGFQARCLGYQLTPNQSCSCLDYIQKKLFQLFA